jgi:hypothetical protein
MAGKRKSPADAARALRADARYAEVFNSGLEVWLYDAGHRQKLKASGAFETELETAELDRRMREFGAQGLIMAYQLEEDNSLSVAVCVGEPLSDKELAAARWLEPQKAFLRVPSGRLVVESNDALTIRSEAPSDKGAELEVPPGDYLATLYRIDHDALEADELAWKGPEQIIVLTSGAVAKPVPGQPAFLPWEPRGPGDAKWSVEGGTYQGMALVHDADTTVSVALDLAGAERLGLTDGALARLSIAALKIDCVLVYLVGDTQKGEFYQRMDKLLPPAGYAGGEWAHCWLQVGMDRLFGMRRNPQGRVAKKLQETWHPATMTLLPQRALEKKRRG